MNSQMAIDSFDPSLMESIEASSRKRDDRTIVRALGIIERRASAPGRRMSDIATCGAYFRLRLGGELREHFEVAFLDAQHRLLSTERLFSGTIDGAQVFPRVVVQRALALNAAAVIVAHNHPSGSLDPSAADKAITTRLKSVLEIVDIRFLDHFIVGASDALSMAGKGLM